MREVHLLWEDRAEKGENPVLLAVFATAELAEEAAEEYGEGCFVGEELVRDAVD